MGKTVKVNYKKIGNLLDLNPAVTFTLRFWHYNTYMLSRTLKKKKKSRKEIVIEALPDAHRM